MVQAGTSNVSFGFYLQRVSINLNLQRVALNLYLQRVVGDLRSCPALNGREWERRPESIHSL
jgi:hypothetical protein